MSLVINFSSCFSGKNGGGGGGMELLSSPAEISFSQDLDVFLSSLVRVAREERVAQWVAARPTL